MPTQTIICLVVFVATLALYMSNKFPLPLVSMAAMGIYVITGCLEPKAALSCFSNSSVIIMGSMFIVAGGLSRTQMVHRVTNLAYKVSGGSFQKGMILYCLVTLAIAQVAPSAILIFSICYPLVSDFCRKNNQSPSKAMFSIVLICICTVTSLPIGSGATSYITANTMWETYGVTAREGMFDPMLVYMPTLVLSEKEAMESLTMPPIFLYIGSLAVGNALVASGAGDFIAQGLQAILGENPSKWLVIILFWFAGFIVTQFMSNMALYSALQPVVLLLCATYAWNPTGLFNMLWKATFTSYLTPLSTVAIPLCMSVGGYKQKDLLRMGLVPALVISVANIVWCGLFFPPY